MAPVRGAAPITERKRESSAPPYCRHAISARSNIVHLRANSGPRSPLTRAFSISGRCRGKGTRRPINATYPAHHPARSSLWMGATQKALTGPRRSVTRVFLYGWCQSRVR
jgi:hypothetical protein